MIYKSFVRSVYIRWHPRGTPYQKHRAKLQRFQNKVLNIIVEAPRYTRTSVLHNDLQVETIDQFFDRAIRTYHDKVPLIGNPIIPNSHVHARQRDRFKYPKD